jgi:hypothetical protein
MFADVLLPRLLGKSVDLGEAKTLPDLDAPGRSREKRTVI